MTILGKLTTASAASVAALGLSMSAGAAVIVSGSVNDSDTTLTATNNIEIDNDQIELVAGEERDLVDDNNDGSFTVGDGVTAGLAAYAVTFADFVERASIRDLVITFSQDGIADQVFTVTDGVGELVPGGFTIDLMAGNTVSFVVTGTAFSITGANPGYSFDIFAAVDDNPIPLPAAGLLFLTALGGAGAARARKKA